MVAFDVEFETLEDPLADIKMRALAVSKFEVRRFISSQNTGGTLLEKMCGYDRKAMGMRDEAKEQKRQLNLSPNQLMEEWEDSLYASGVRRPNSYQAIPDEPIVKNLDERGKKASLPINQANLIHKSVVIRYPGIHNVLFKSPFIPDFNESLHTRRVPRKPKQECLEHSHGHGGVGINRSTRSRSVEEETVRRPAGGYYSHNNWNRVSESEIWKH